MQTARSPWCRRAPRCESALPAPSTPSAPRCKMYEYAHTTHLRKALARPHNTGCCMAQHSATVAHVAAASLLPACLY